MRQACAYHAECRTMKFQRSATMQSAVVKPSRSLPTTLLRVTASKPQKGTLIGILRSRRIVTPINVIDDKMVDDGWFCFRLDVNLFAITGESCLMPANHRLNRNLA